MTADVKEVLLRARQRIERGWAQGSSARNKNGNIVPVNTETAVSWCITGAIYGEAKNILTFLDAHREIQFALARMLTEKEQVIDVVGYNDDPVRKKEEILALFDRALNEDFS